MTIHEVLTSLTPEQVVQRAGSFFPHAGGPYASFPSVVGQAHLKLHLDVGEVTIGVVREADATRVRASASRGSHLVARFLTTLGPPLDAIRTVYRHGQRELERSSTAVLKDGPAARESPDPGRGRAADRAA